MEKTREKLKGKKILIWGYGREGKSTERLLKEQCEPAVIDVYEGKRDGVQEENYDYVFVSPGIDFHEDAPAFDNARFTSETEVFLEEYGKNTLGITGTKGKSTTTSMLYHVLKECGRKAFLMGNIGLPCFDHLQDMDDDSIAVFELSCHQCQRLQADPHIAVFLDLYEDHLDRYHTMDAYFDAKCGITKHQKESDYLYLGKEVPPVKTLAQKILIGPEDAGEFDLKVPGDHNRYNAEFVFRIATERFGCGEEEVRSALSTFTGLDHRLQFAGTYGGIDWYDDSISTIPEASINAMNSVRNAGTLLLGGMDRGIDYDILVDFIRSHPQYRFILAYASGARIYGEVKDLDNTWYAEDLDAQVRLAGQITPGGKAVILSPAAASYGYFKNFEERGDYFKKLVAHGADAE